MNIVLLGYPGSGKGTQAEALSREMNLFHISTGDMFRDEIIKGTPLGMKVREYLESGKLVDDKTVLEIIKTKIENYKNGFLFDGFPRTYEQAEGLDNLLAARGHKINAVIFLRASEEEVIRRLGSRRICPKCSRVYNLVSNPPRETGKCDECSAELVQRQDDKPEVLKKRLMVYVQLTEPLLSYYKSTNLFYEINANSAPEEITKKILDFLRAIQK